VCEEETVISPSKHCLYQMQRGGAPQLEYLVLVRETKHNRPAYGFEASPKISSVCESCGDW
jgi:hypothetical protein